MKAPPPSINVTQSIVQDLGTAIVVGKFNNVLFPSESEIAEQYGAARTVTREAVKMLISKGLISSRRRRGIIVNSEDQWSLFDPDVLRWLLERKFSIDLLIEFTEIRLSVEPGAAALAAERASGKERAAIAHAIDRMLAAEDGRDDPLTSDIAFHVAVLEASGNRFYRQMREMIETALRISIRKTNDASANRLTPVLEHKRVADAILTGNAKEAEQRMRSLIQLALTTILKMKTDEVQAKSHG